MHEHGIITATEGIWVDVLEAITNRRSVRGFKNEPVSREILEKLIEAAIRAPSAVNTQPWEFIVVTGKPRDEMIEMLDREIASPVQPQEEQKPKLPDRLRANAKIHFREALAEAGISMEDFAPGVFRFFDAPAIILVTLEKSLRDHYPLYAMDTGAAVQNLLLAATSYGLGTCWETGFLKYEAALRWFLNLDANKEIVCGVAVGYPDPDAPLNRAKTTRARTDEVTRWLE